MVEKNKPMISEVIQPFGTESKYFEEVCCSERSEYHLPVIKPQNWTSRYRGDQIHHLHLKTQDLLYHFRTNISKAVDLLI